MENQYSEKFCEDIVRISNILPNLPVETICSELNKVVDKEDGVHTVLKKYLLTYDINRQNAMSDDIKKIKRVVPNYSIVNITKDLSEFANEPYRVQLLLKKYFENESLPAKRSFDNLTDTDDTSPGKKLKSEVSPDLNSTNCTMFYDVLDEINPETKANNTVEKVICKSVNNDLIQTNNDSEQERPGIDPTNISSIGVTDSQPEQSSQSTQEYLWEDILDLFAAQRHDDMVYNEANNVKENQSPAPMFVNSTETKDFSNRAVVEAEAKPIPHIKENMNLHLQPGTSKIPITSSLAKRLLPLTIASTSTAQFPIYNDAVDDDDVVITSVQVGNKPTELEPIDLTTLSNSIPEAVACKKEIDNAKPGTEHPFFFKLMAMFPDVSPHFLRTLCEGKPFDDNQFDCLVNFLLEDNYERRIKAESPGVQLDFEEQHKLLLDLFPDADPSYLQNHCERLIDHPDQFRQFISTMLETKSYPSKADYLKKIKLSAQEKQYTTEFDVTKFLEVIPNPEEHFNDTKRTVSYKHSGDTNYALTFLKNHFRALHVREIIHVYNEQKTVLNSARVLENCKQTMRAKRKLYPLTSCQNIPLLQEIAYVTYKHDILDYLKHQEEIKILERKVAKEAGLLKTCGCCFDDEIMPADIACCEAGHIFCKECVKKGCEVVIGQGMLQFRCLELCDSHFSLQVLQAVLSPKVFSKMAQRKQLEEVKAAGIEELEFCPFCDFATIPAPGDKLFRCLNDECMKEACRQCREPSHIPLRCDEVEKEEEVKTRIYIEDKMTEALIRQCYKCSLKFVKEEGCNKMTCSCGAMMCYVCNKPVKDYTHFNGQGGEQHHLCPLFSDTEKLHMDAVKRSAQVAKKELGIGTTKQLKYDPTEDLEKHYKKRHNHHAHHNHQHQ